MSYRGQLGLATIGIDTIADKYLDPSGDMDMDTSANMDLENSTGVFITSSDLPHDPLFLEVGRVVELDTGATAPKVQVIHNVVAADSEIKLQLSSINVTKTLAIGYCLPASANIEVFSFQFQAYMRNLGVSG